MGRLTCGCLNVKIYTKRTELTPATPAQLGKVHTHADVSKCKRGDLEHMCRERCCCCRSRQWLCGRNILTAVDGCATWSGGSENRTYLFVFQEKEKKIMVNWSSCLAPRNEPIKKLAVDQIRTLIFSHRWNANFVVWQEQPGLVKQQSVAGWTVYKCYNCDMHTHTVRGNTKVLVNCSLKVGHCVSESWLKSLSSDTVRQNFFVRR